MNSSVLGWWGGLMAMTHEKYVAGPYKCSDRLAVVIKVITRQRRDIKSSSKQSEASFYTSLLKSVMWLPLRASVWQVYFWWEWPRTFEIKHCVMKHRSLEFQELMWSPRLVRISSLDSLFPSGSLGYHGGYKCTRAAVVAQINDTHVA